MIKGNKVCLGDVDFAISQVLFLGMLLAGK